MNYRTFACTDICNLINRVSLVTSRYVNAVKALHIGSENIGPDTTAMILPKRSPLLSPINSMYGFFCLRQSLIA